MAHRRERVLQTAPLAHVHVHVAGRGERQPMPFPERVSSAKPLAIAAVAHQLHRDPGTAREMVR